MADQRYTGQEKEKSHLLGDIAKTSSIIGGGLLAYRNRSAIGKAVNELTSNAALTGSRVLSKDGRAYSALSDARVFMQGISDSLGDNPSVIRTVRAGFDNNVQEKMRQNFEASVRNNIKKRQMLSNRPGQNNTEFANRYYKEFHKRNTGGLNKFEYAATQSFRQNKILEGLQKQSAIKNNGGDKILNALTHYHNQNKGIFNSPADHINDFTKELEKGTYSHKVSFKDETQRNIFQKQMLQTLEQYQSTQKVFQANKGVILNQAKAMETGAAYGFIKDALQQTSVLSGQFKKRGFNHTTLKQAEKFDVATKRKYGLIIDDVDEKGNDKAIDVTKELRKFLDSNRHNGELNSLLGKKGLSFNFDDIILDKHLFTHSRTGEILDNRHLKDGVTSAIDSFQESVKVPFLNINPVDLTPWQAFRSGQAKEGLHVLGAGQVHGFVRNLGDQTFDGAAKATQSSAIRGGLNNANHFYTGGNVFRYTESGGLDLIDEGLYLAPSQFGAFSRMHKNMTNYSEKDVVDERGWIKKLFDVGHQEGESRVETYKKAWNKLSDPKYGPNALRSMVYDLHTTQEGQADIIRDVYNVMRVGIDKNATSLNREASEVLAPHVNKLFNHIKVNGEAFDFARLADDDYVKDAALVFNRELKDQSSNIGMYKSHTRSVYGSDLSSRETSKLYEDPSVRELNRWTQKYINDPEGFNSAREAAIDKKLPSELDFMVPSFGDDQALIPATEKLRRSFHQYALRSLDNEMGDFAPQAIKNGERKRSSIAYLIDAREKGVLSANDVKNAKDLELLTDLLGYDNIHNIDARVGEAKTFLEDVMNIRGNKVGFDDTKLVFENGGVHLTGLGQDLQEGILRAQPIWGRAPEPSKASPNGSDFIIMRKSGLGKAGKELVSELNLQNISNYGPIDNGWDLAINTEMYARNASSTLVEQGHNVVKEMFAGRHKNGDSLENVTTSTAIMYGLAERLDNQLGNFGLSLSQQNLGSFQSIISNQYVRRVALPYMAYQQAVYFDGLTGDSVSDTAADAYVNTHTTLQGIKETLGINKALRPWANVFKNAGADQVGEWLGVKQLDFLTMGLFSDFRSGEDTKEYYESGEDAIRKNRYWGIGSPSPWAGGGIDHFEANWYRKLKSDYKFTDTMYGSESEYWANNWMPTLTHPFAPIKHFLTDPYHYENKHEADRPYAITGGFSELQNIPLVGNLIDGTVGRILKPRKEHEGLEKAHEEYISSINQYIQDQYSPVKDGSYIGISGTGAISQYNMYANQGTGDYFGGTAATYGSDAGNVNYGNGITPTYKTGSQPSGGLDGVGVGTGGVGQGGGSGSQASQQFLAEQNYALAQMGDGVEAGTVSSLMKLRNMSLPQNLSDIGTLDNLRGMITDGFYSASEITGIYGFLTKTGIGYNESWRGTTLAPSTLMSSPSRAFWDMNLGGAGGSLSEIGRRYLPRDPNKDYYSPIRNTMPDWLPSIGDSIDFLHGDPYTKIQKGEMRLPGRSYEKLYKLHPDGTGTGDFSNYGVFDRFRILADVDPDSEQYKVAKHQVSLLRQAGGLTEDMDKEFDEITKQVHDKQDTYHWYDKKFSNADIQEKNVTISKVIDANTFMVREFDAPIKLAGIKLTQKDNQDVINWLGQYLKVGAKIKIGFAEDPVARMNNDTYGSMDAVVYANKNEDGRFWFESNKGQSLNALIANRNWKNPVQIKDDGSPTSTAALYSNDMITVGKYTEMLTHDILPKIPFVGILADKFLQVRTPIESYKRDQVYGTDWRPWTHPYEGWIKPMVNTVASQNPLIAGAEMAAIGHLWGKTTKAKGLGRVAGFAIGAGLSTLRVFDEGAGKLIPGGDNVWLPQEREDEREINQYFDRLKYVKYRGLYEQARKLAKSEEGVDVEEFFDASAEKGRKNKGLKRYLTDKKKTLSWAKKMGYGDAEAVESQIDDLSNGLDEISSAKEAYQAGKYTSLAIKYRQEYEGTLYSMGENGATDRTALMRALTPKEREYVPRFLETTSSKERQEILKYVPKDIKRILQGSWGLKVDKQEDIEDYFDSHYLPGENWSGWNASSNLDDVKIKVMKKQGVNPTTSGYWTKDQARADQSGAKAIPIHSLSSLIDSSRLHEVLSGMGLSDIDVQLTTSYAEGPGGINTSINIMKDVKNEILDTINEGKDSLF
ncbi:hypothetical protein ABWK22_02645 [Gottfriedia acidiceleris]|uniref:hypothetical protein n=1 Tax=Gottfriedia acidiceleris TaxID=371036 RepID=UPI00339639FE